MWSILFFFLNCLKRFWHYILFNVCFLCLILTLYFRLLFSLFVFVSCTAHNHLIFPGFADPFESVTYQLTAHGFFEHEQIAAVRVCVPLILPVCAYVYVFVCGRVLSRCVDLLFLWIRLPLFEVNFRERCEDSSWDGEWRLTEIKIGETGVKWRSFMKERKQRKGWEKGQVTFCSRRSISFCSLLTWTIHWLSSS